MKGILDEKSLLASQIHFLNDTQEFKYSLSIFEKVIAKLQNELPKKTTWQQAIELSSPSTSDPIDILPALYGSMKDLVLDPILEKPPICVFSLSKDGDLLSQWRGYCPPSGGYSIGFRLDSLTQFSKTHGLYLEPCIYDRTKQEAIIKEAIIKVRDTTLKNWTPEAEISKFIQEPVVKFFIDFSKIASALKHPKFEEENEWRIISNLIPNKDMEFRVKKSIMLPYFSISFGDFEPFLIDEIIVGPAPEKSLAESSLRQFILKKKLNISIRTSEIPYREF